jgi:hypothetical protein
VDVEGGFVHMCGEKGVESLGFGHTYWVSYEQLALLVRPGTDDQMIAAEKTKVT